MGLGKTKMICTFLRGLFYSHIVERAIIIVPASLPNSWIKELDDVGLYNVKAFTRPSDQTHQIALSEVIKSGGILVTTFETYRSNHTVILREGHNTWDYVLVDEAHRVKNENTQIYETLDKVDCKHRIILSGTPIQNNLKEFHALMHFCCPNLLGKYENFNKEYRLPIERAKYQDATAKQRKAASQAFNSLRERITPYMLRRTKELLKAEGRLGSNYELTVWLKLAPLQRQLMEELFDGKTLKFSIHGHSLSGGIIAQDICNHPFLLMEPREMVKGKQKISLTEEIRRNLLGKCPLSGFTFEEYKMSCKLSFLLHIVPNFIKNNHKILIFSDSPKMLEFAQIALQTIVEDKKIIRMDGSTPARVRTQLINAFQPPPKVDKSKSEEASTSEHGYDPEDVEILMDGPSIFLLSKRACGVGLTLTNASRVIIMEPAKNPCDDNQAIDRAYRVGQKNDVVVYRLVSCGAIEEHRYQQQIVKGQISYSILGEQCRRALKKREERVLKKPDGGFDVSLTHLQLTSICCNNFHESLEEHILFIKSLGSVFDIFNHSLLFNIKEIAPALVVENMSPQPAVTMLQDTWLLDQRRARPLLEEEPQDKGHGASTCPSNSCGKKMEIPTAMVGVIIGACGETLRKLQRESHARIYVAKDNETVPGALTRQIELSGTPNQVREAERRISETLARANAKSSGNASSGQKYNSPRQELKMKIPNSKVGFFIGKGGKTIKSIIAKSGAQIQVIPQHLPPGDLSTERTVRICGTKEQIEDAKQQVHGVISGKADAGSSGNASSNQSYDATLSGSEQLRMRSLDYMAVPFQLNPGDECAERTKIIDTNKEQTENAMEPLGEFISSENCCINQMPGESQQSYHTQAKGSQPGAPPLQEHGPQPTVHPGARPQYGADQQYNGVCQTGVSAGYTQRGYCPPFLNTNSNQPVAPATLHPGVAPHYGGPQHPPAYASQGYDRPAAVPWQCAYPDQLTYAPLASNEGYAPQHPHALQGYGQPAGPWVASQGESSRQHAYSGQQQGYGNGAQQGYGSGAPQYGPQHGYGNGAPQRHHASQGYPTPWVTVGYVDGPQHPPAYASQGCDRPAAVPWQCAYPDQLTYAPLASNEGYAPQHPHASQCYGQPAGPWVALQGESSGQYAYPGRQVCRSPPSQSNASQIN